MSAQSSNLCHTVGNTTELGFFDYPEGITEPERVRLNKIKRVQLAESAKKPNVKEMLIEKCRRDCCFFINYFVYTYDPRTKGQIPFVLYPFQVDIINKLVHSIDTQEDILIEKSRDMGVSWLILMVFLWFFLFRPGCNFKIGSKKADDVDKLGEISSLMPKIRFAMQYLPLWLLPDGWNARKHSCFMSIKNPANHNSIDGESCNPDFSRSGRYRAVLFDEFAFWPFSNPAWDAAQGSTNCRIAISTPMGRNNRFGRLACGKPEDLLHNKMTIHWKLHPLKDEAWYQRECKRSTPDAIARELDINYSLSTRGAVIKEFKRGFHVVSQPYQFNPELKTVVSFDFGTTNGCLIGQIDKYDALHVFKEIVLYENGNDDHLAQATLAFLATLDFSIHKPEFTADPSGRNQLGSVEDDEKSTHIKILESHGLSPISYRKAMVMTSREKKGIALLRNLFNRRNTQGNEYIQIYEPHCETLIQSLETEYKYKLDRNGEPLDIIEQKHPWEDVVDMLRYIAIEFYSTDGMEARGRFNASDYMDQPPEVTFAY